MKKKILLFFSSIFLLVFLMFPLSVSAANPFKLTIVSSQRGGLDPGHAFLVITNNSSSNVTVGPYILRKGQQVSLGMRDGFREHLAEVGGAYYNVEAAYPGGYNDFTYKTISISSAQVSTIANYFRLNSYYNSLGDVMYHNCTTFAIRAWNKVAPVKYQFEENLIDFPYKLKEAIRKLDGSKSGTNLVGTVLKEKLKANNVYYISKDSKIIPYKVVSTKFMRLEVLNCNRIKLTWQEASDKNINGQDMVTGYTIVYRGPDGVEKTIDIKDKDTTQYTVRNLAANTSYQFIMAPVFKKYGYDLAGKATSISTRKTENCKVSLNRTSATINLAKSKKLTLEAVSTGKHPDNLKKVTWKSSDTSVATVSSTGVVTGKAAGTATIKATIHGKSAICKVKVIKPVITVTPSKATMQVKKSGTLTAKVKGTTEKVKWKTSNSNVVSISASGNSVKLTAKRKGTATITAYIGNVKDTCVITVKEVNWKSLYYNFLKKAETSFSYKTGVGVSTATAKSFYLLHLNSDNIPELVVSPLGDEWSTWNVYYVFTIKNNKVVYCGMDSERDERDVSYNKKYRAIKIDWWTNGIGGVGTRLLAVRNGKLVEAKYAYSYEEGSKRIYKIGNSQASSKKVSAASSDAFGKKYFNSKDVVYGTRLLNTESVRRKQFK